MKINKLLLIATLTILFSCSNEQDTQQVETSKEKSNALVSEHSEVDQNSTFNEFKSKFIEEFWKLNPGYALYVGYYEYDDQLVVPDQENTEANLAFIKTYLKQLNQFDIAKLDNNNASDFYIIKNQLESSNWYITTYKGGEWNPARYNVAGAFGLILNTDYKSLDERLKTISKRLENIPAYYQVAIKNITVPTLEHTDLAIQQNKGALGVFQASIPEKMNQSTLKEEEKQQLQAKLDKAVESINGYLSWLQKKRAALADGTARDFRIGKEIYEQKFKYDIVSDYSSKELFDRAIQSKNELHEQMIKITSELWPKYFPNELMPDNRLAGVKQLIDHLSVKHIEREKFVDEVKRQIPIIEAYIKEADLLDMDPSRPLVVRETPEYQRGIAGASVNAPGPYDATANTYYNVTPLDHYTPEQAESYLREYNHWILQILNIHEAVPGHYVQLVHSNKSPSMIKSIFGNGAMVEGWAVYSERMMLESGYGNQEPELWLMYSKWNLRVVVNTIIDYSIGND